MPSEYIQARKSQFHFYKAVPLYTKVGDDTYVLYKPQGITLGKMRVSQARHPESLYIKTLDKILGIQEAQKAFNQKLEREVASGNFKEIKKTLAVIMEETLTEPRSGSLEGISNTMDILNEYVTKSDVLKNLLDVSNTDYSTIMHSINVMAFVLGFAVSAKYSKTDIKTLGLAALLHDVGKTKVSPNILNAPRKLNGEEFRMMQQHTVLGYNILKKCRFDSREISRVALDHHEKLDRNGYPNGKGNISEMSQIIGIIDCYEALTNDVRPYRNAMTPYDAMSIIKKDVMVGRVSKRLFEIFTHSLGSMEGKT